MESGRSIRAALYVRVSTEEQAAEGFSLDAQMRRLEKYCEMEGWTVADRYREEGHSGRSDRRPEYLRMMSERDRWDVLLVLKMDRIHRNSKNFTSMMDELSASGKDFCSVQEKFDTQTAAGRFVMDVMQRIAQFESEQIGERVKVGMELKAKKGLGILGSGHPYGYNIKHGEYVVNIDEMHIVRTIFKLYNGQYSMDDIASELNRAGFTAKKGGKWCKSTIGKILRNPLYAGYVKWDGKIRLGTHTAIIEQGLYESINGPIITADDKENIVGHA